MNDIQEKIYLILEAIKGNTEEALDEMEKKLKGVTDATVDSNREFSSAAKSANQLRLQMVGLLFFGKSVEATFKGLISPAAETAGIFEIWGITLQTVFLPVILALMPIFLSISEALMNMPEDIKLLIGAFVLVGLAIAVVVGAFAQLQIAMFSLGISSMAAFGPIIAVIAGIALVVVGLYQTFKGKFEGIGLIIMGIGTILLLFIGWWALIPIAVGAAVYLIIKYWEEIKTFFQGLWDWIKNLFSNIWTGLGNWFNAGKNLVVDFINGIKSVGYKIASTLWNLLPEWLRKFISSGIDVIGGLFGGGGLKTSPSPSLSSGSLATSNQVVINQNNQISVANTQEFERMISRNNSKIVDEVSRQVKS